MDDLGPVIVVHGGAGDIPDSRVDGKIRGVLEAAAVGRDVLLGGGTSLDACVAAVRHMELDENFNAGRGSVLTSAGDLEMEAAVMEGKDLRAGAITLVSDVRHPISAARVVMEQTPHVLIGGDGARNLLRKHGVETCPTSELVTEWARKALSDGNGESLSEYICIQRRALSFYNNS